MDDDIVIALGFHRIAAEIRTKSALELANGVVGDRLTLSLESTTGLNDVMGYDHLVFFDGDRKVGEFYFHRISKINLLDRKSFLGYALKMQERFDPRGY